MNENVRLVIFDWAGTTVDFGCMAPAVVFKKVFEQKKIYLSKEEILKPMGMEKKDHIRELLKLDHVTVDWKKEQGYEWTENDVDEMYLIFEAMLSDIVADYSVVIPGVEETISQLKEEGIKIGSTTGYTREIMDRVLAKAAEGGYSPDYLVTPDVVGSGRPGPFMIYENMRQAGIYPISSVVKVGDTIMDISEGVNAGVWTVGILEGSSLAGLSQEEAEQMSDAEKTVLYEQAEKKYREAGADYVIRNITELPNIIKLINKSFDRKENK